MIKINDLKTGQRIRISGTLVYGNVDFIFDSETIYVLLSDTGKQCKLKISEIRHPFRIAIRNKFVRITNVLTDFFMWFFSEKTEKYVRAVAIYSMIALFAINIIHFIYSLSKL